MVVGFESQNTMFSNWFGSKIRIKGFQVNNITLQHHNLNMHPGQTKLKRWPIASRFANKGYFHEFGVQVTFLAKIILRNYFRNNVVSEGSLFLSVIFTK